MENVSAIVGGDKFWWPSFSANEEKVATLFSSKAAANNVTLLYSIGGKQRSWEGAALAQHDVNYEIKLTVNAAGVVSERTCPSTCR